MNILVISFGKGGGARNFRFLLQTMGTTFPEDNYHVVTLEKSDFDECTSLPNVHVHELPVRFHRELTRMRFGFSGIKKFVSKTNADLVWCGYNNVYVKLSVPVVMNMSSVFMTKPWREARFHWEGTPVRLAAMRFFFRQTLRCTSKIIVQTGMVRDDLEAFGFSGDRVAVVPKSVEDMNDVTPLPLTEEQERVLGGYNNVFTFLYVATYYRHKNHRVLVSALELLAKRKIDARLALTLSRDDLEKIGEKATLELVDRGIILPLGWVDKGQLRTLYDRCDGCLMPSLFESLSSAHLEAMAWKKPQVCADLPYARDLCGNAAVYVAPHDADAWATQMAALKNDLNLQQTLIQAGQERMKLFPTSWTEVAKRYHEVFEEVVKGQGGNVCHTFR